MKKIILNKTAFDVSKLNKSYASETDFDVLVTEDSILFDTEGRLLAVYVVNPSELHKQIAEILPKIKYDTTKRTSGITTTSTIFGYRPRDPMRARNYCSSSKFSAVHKEMTALLSKLAEECVDFYRKNAPELYHDHTNKLEGVLPEWRMKNTVFTSGIINKNNKLPYHYDSGNFDGVFSNMVAWKKDCKGGYLCLPEYRVALEIANGSISLFDGQKILHGVTPFTRLNDDAYRYTAVFYSLKNMWKCKTLTEEIQFAQQHYTEQLKKRAK